MDTNKHELIEGDLAYQIVGAAMAVPTTPGPDCGWPSYLLNSRYDLPEQTERTTVVILSAAKNLATATNRFFAALRMTGLHSSEKQ